MNYNIVTYYLEFICTIVFDSLIYSETSAKSIGKLPQKVLANYHKKYRINVNGALIGNAASDGSETVY